MVRSLAYILILTMSVFSRAEVVESRSSKQDIFILGSDILLNLDLPDNVMSSQFRALAQDAYGFLWLGTEKGLYRYDGYEFKRFIHDPDNPNSIHENFVYAICPMPDGRIWISTSTVLSVYDPKTEYFVRYQHDPNNNSLINNEITQITPAKDGGLWISTYGGVDHLDPVSMTFTHYVHDPDDPNSLNDNTVYRTLEDKSGNLWVGTRKGLSFKPKGFNTFKPMFFDSNDEESLYMDPINDIIEGQDGKIWLGGLYDGVSYIENGELFRHHPSYEKASWLIDGQARNVLQANDDEIWVTSFGHGVAILDAHTGALLRSLEANLELDTALSDRNISAKLRDQSGLIWLGQRGGRGGLNYSNSAASAARMLYNNPKDKAALDIERINAVVQASSGDVWVAGRGINRISPESGRLPIEHEGLKALEDLSRSEFPILGLTESADGRLWFLFYNHGIFSYDSISGKVVPYLEQDIGCNEIITFTQDKLGNFWLGCVDNPTIVHFNPNSETLQSFKLDPTGIIKFSNISRLLMDKSGVLWVASEHGLFFLKNALQPTSDAEIERVERLDVYVSNLLVDEKNQLWIDTQSGLYRLDSDGKLEYLSEKMGLSKTEVFAGNMIADKRGWIWGDRGVLDTEKLKFYAISQADAFDLYRNWPNASALTRSGTMLFGGYNGLQMVRPELFKPWNYQPELRVSRFSLDQSARPSVGLRDVVMSSTNKHLALELSATDYSAPLSLKYKYKLEPFDEAWNETDATRRVVSYSQLPAGEYELSLMASSRFHKWPQTARVIKVVVRPQWYETWWFFTLSAIFMLISLYSFYVLRLRQVENKRRVLKALVAKQTQDLQERNQSLEEQTTILNDTVQELVLTQKQLAEREKMASLAGLVAGVAHEVNTPIGIGITAASHLENISEAASQHYESGTLTQSKLEHFLSHTKRSSSVLLSSLKRSAKLVQSFKGMVVDASTGEIKTFDMVHCIQQTLTTLGPQLRDAKADICLKCPDDCEIESHASSISQLITQLVENALLHGLHDRSDKRIMLEVKKMTASYQIAFSDNGKGILEADLPKIFEPFFTTSNSQNDTGLGLSIVFNLVNQKLQGDIRCESKSGQGARFVVDIPKVYPSQMEVLNG